MCRPVPGQRSAPLAGLKLIGFSIWERRGGSGRNVMFPARQYSINGERRSFALLRPIVDTTAQNRMRELILEAFAALERTTRCRADPRTISTTNLQGRRSDPQGRDGRGVAIMHTVPDWLQTAFAEWITGRVYVDARGNYCSRVLGRHRVIVGYNRLLKRAYPHHQDFHRAANCWLSLWEVTPTANIERMKCGS